MSSRHPFAAFGCCHADAGDAALIRPNERWPGLAPALPRQAATLLEQAGRRARRRLQPSPPWLLVLRAVLVLAESSMVRAVRTKSMAQSILASPAYQVRRVSGRIKRGLGNARSDEGEAMIWPPKLLTGEEN